MADERHDPTRDPAPDLARDLAALGRSIETPAASDRLATAVLERVAVLPSPTGVDRWARLRAAARTVATRFASPRRRIALVVVAVLLALLATPPVRAAVADWFGFGAVRIERGSTPSESAPPPPEVPDDASLSRAAAEVDFALWAPTELGAPDGVAVSDDQRSVSMSWSHDADGVVRLDQFDARLDFSVAKTVPSVQYASVGGTDALWFEEPHEVVLLEPDGSRRRESARLAGHTLVWQAGGTTLRLEGDLTRERAVEIAESVVPVP
jgi:hypothetical protein